MEASPRALPRPDPGRRRWWSYILPTGVLLFVAYQVGKIIQNPNRRVIESAAGGLLFYLALRLSIYQSLAFFLVVYPFPTVTTLGSTNSMIMLVIAIVWSMRVSAGELTIKFNGLLTPILPVVVFTYLLSCFNVHTQEEVDGAFRILFDVGSGLILYLCMINFVVEEKSLRRIIFFFGLSSCLIHGVAFYEVLFPGKAFLQGFLIDARSKELLERYGYRAGSAFRDFELLSEYCAVTAPIMAFMFLRSEAKARPFWGALVFFTIVSLFATVTRGGFISLAVGATYLFFLLRKEIGIAKSFGTLLAVFSTIGLVGAILPQVFHMQSLYKRLEQTKIVHGVPDSRVYTWAHTWVRAQEHFFIGHGPWYTFGSGLVKWTWPHNGYIFLWVTIGLFGLLAYLGMFFTCLVASYRAGGPYLSGDFSKGLLTALHVSWLVFIVDQMKIDFGRNQTYFVFTWFMLALTATAYQVAKSGEASRARAAAKPEPPPPRAPKFAPLAPVGIPAAAPPRIRKIFGN